MLLVGLYSLRTENFYSLVFCLGGITFTCFIIQVATGFAMTFYYRPTVSEAFLSVQYIMNDVNFGWLIRSVHRWSASMMVCEAFNGLDFSKSKQL